MERVTGVEPVSSPWKGDIIPLYDPRLYGLVYLYALRFSRKLVRMEFKDFMKRRHIITFIALAAVVGGSYSAVRLTLGSRGVPQDFQDARLSGALVAQNIVDLANKSSDNLDRVSQLVNQDHDYVGALNLVTQIASDSQKIRDQATPLSSDLQKMTAALSSVQSFDARQAALEAISSQLAL